MRDLLRQRALLVQRRAEEYGHLSHLLLRQGILDSSRHDIEEASEAELEQWFAHPLVQLTAQQELDRIALYSEQISNLEQIIHERTRDQVSFERLLQGYGIGKILALTILYEVGEISRFESMRQLRLLLPRGARSGTVWQCVAARPRKQAGASLSEVGLFTGGGACGALLSESAALL